MENNNNNENKNGYSMAYYVMYERAGSISLGHDSVATVALLSSRSDEHFKYWDLAGNSLPSS